MHDGYYGLFERRLTHRKIDERRRRFRSSDSNEPTLTCQFFGHGFAARRRELKSNRPLRWFSGLPVKMLRNNSNALSPGDRETDLTFVHSETKSAFGTQNPQLRCIGATMTPIEMLRLSAN